MLFWIVCATLVAAIAFALALTLIRPRGDALPAEAQDLQVYRAQLAEIEKDLARGVLAADEAARTRVEISRRLLEADRALQAAVAGGDAPRRATLAAAVLTVALLAGAFVLYDQLGAAGQPDAPLAKRLADADALYRARPDQASAEKTAEADRKDAEAKAAAAGNPVPQPDPKFVELMERLRKAVSERPNDPQGLVLLAQNEMALGNYHAGWEAQKRLIALKGDKAEAEDYTRLGEFQTVAAGGLVTADAEAAFAKALEMNPKDARALFYVGMMMGQNDRPDRAFRLWDAALRVSSPDDPWVPEIAQGIDALAWLAGEQDYTAPMPVPNGPSAEQMQAAQGMAPADRMAMIRGMVENLNARLANEGGASDDWAKLISSLRVLGEKDRAEVIATEARTKFTGRAEDLAKIDAAAATPLGTPEAAAPAMPGPSADQVEAAGQMSDSDRQAMIEGMVGRLVDRLTTQGGSAEEWARAVGALATLGKADQAKEMLAKGQSALADDAAGLATLEAAAKSAGVAP